MTTSTSRLDLPTGPVIGAGFVTGGVQLILRLEGGAVLAAAAAFYFNAGFSWVLFAVLFLTPDLSMLGYLAGPRIGAAAYNLVHTYAVALALAGAGFFAGLPLVEAVGVIFLAHIGFDRALGYGLKYRSAFADTHLGRIGRR